MVPVVAAALIFQTTFGDTSDPDLVKMELRFAVWDRDGSIKRGILEFLEEEEAKATSTIDRTSLTNVPLHFLRAGANPDEWIIESINATYNAPSPAVSYLGPQTLHIYGTRPAESELPSGESIVATAELPRGCSSALLLLVPNNGNNAGNGPLYKVVTLRTDEEHFPRGAMQIINLSQMNFKMAANKVRADLAPRSVNIIEPEQQTSEALHIQIAAWDDNRNQWRVFFERHLPNLGKRRAICFIVDNPNAFGRFSTRFISIP